MMQTLTKKRHIIDTLFILTLLFSFAFAAILIIALGASIYQRGVTASQENYEDRTAYSYLLQKVRQGDESGAVSVGKMGDSSALLITQDINGSSYTTYLYVYNNSLMELLTNTDATLSPESGQRILDMKRIEVASVSNSLYKVILTDMDGDRTDVFFTQYAEKGGLQ